MGRQGLRVSLALATLTAAACAPTVQRGFVPYEPSGRTAFVAQLGLSTTTFDGDVQDFLEDLGLHMGAGGGGYIDLGARRGNMAVLLGATFSYADASGEAGVLRQHFGNLQVQCARYVSVGTRNELVFSLAWIPDAYLYDDWAYGWWDGKGLAVEAGFCHREMAAPRHFSFLGCRIGYRAVTFDQFQVLGMSSPANVDDSLKSVYLSVCAEIRF